MKIAIVYDWIDKWGGVERLLLALHKQYPDADWYTSYYDKKAAVWAKEIIRTAQDDKIRTSFIQRLPAFIRKSRILSLILYPYAFESFDLSGYDVVISVSSSFAKGVITKPHTKHICYLLTPTRYLWGMTDDYVVKSSVVAQPVLTRLRKWDFIAAQRPDKIITLSKHVAKRIKTYYKREAEVMYPPFDLDYWEKIRKSLYRHPELDSGSYIKMLKQVQHDSHNYYLVVSRLEPYKKVDLLIDIFRKRKDTLVIIGTGSQLSALKRRATPNILFKKNLTDSQLAEQYIHAKALILPQEEDFGYVALEAQFFGCPVICYKYSGVVEALDTTNRNVLVETQSVLAFQHELERFEATAYNVGSRKTVNQAHFEPFSQSNFINSLSSYIQNV